jgi:glutaredoxin-like YruB-family protein
MALDKTWHPILFSRDMPLKEINSHDELLGLLGGKREYVLLYKKGSPISECALNNIHKAAGAHKEIPVFLADVQTVKDIHTRYGITTVPTLMQFEEKKFVNVILGCNEPEFYSSVFQPMLDRSDSGSETPQKRVTVYSTPSCSWCNTLKSHLRRNGIRFTDIDVSQDPRMAEELVRRTGQQGVPQTDIDGEIIVGFDKARINRILGIQ